MLETLEMCNKRLVPSMFCSHLHCPLKLRFLECPPDLTGNKEYVDEADVFFSNPLHWLQTSFPSQSTLPSHIVLFDALEKVEECSQITSLNVYNHWPKPRWYLPAKVATAEFKNHKRSKFDYAFDIPSLFLSLSGDFIIPGGKPIRQTSWNIPHTLSWRSSGKEYINIHERICTED